MGIVRKSQQGFTLIEVLLALVIVAMASFAVVLNIPVSSDDAAQTQARQLYYRLQLMSEEALLSGQEFGVWVSPRHDKLVLAILGEQGWQELNWSKINSEIEIADNLVLDFSIGGDVWQDDERLFMPDSGNQERTLFSEDGSKDDTRLPTPQILLMSSGEVTPFSLKFEPRNHPREGWVVEANDIGQIKILTIDEAEND